MNIFTDVFSNKGKRYFDLLLLGPPISIVIPDSAINFPELCQMVNVIDASTILGIVIYRAT